MANIVVSAAATSINITALPGFAINTPIAQIPAIIASPQATDVQVDMVDATTVTISPQTNDFGGIVAQPAITLNVGTQQDPVSVNQAFSNFKYKFPNFVDSSTSELVAGDIVYLKHVNLYNLYNAQVEKADVNVESKGASNALFIFVEHSSNLLILLHKGFYDYETSDTRVDDWVPGRTTYINQNNKLDVGSDFIGGQWVRSIGFCVPNKDSKHRVWFAGDTTYIKLQNT